MDKEWTKEFQDALETYSSLLSKLVESNPHFSSIVHHEPLIYKIPDEENEIKMKFLNKIDSPLADDVYRVFCDYLAHGIYRTWQDKLSDYNTYLDLVIRKVLMNPPGEGISYLCLSVAGEIQLTDPMRSEIDISKQLCPVLPFGEEELKALLGISRTEDRLRFGLMISHTIGKLCSGLKIRFTLERFIQNLSEILQRSKDHEVNFLIQTFTSRKIPTFCSSPPPSPVERSVGLIRPETDWITGRPFF